MSLIQTWLNGTRNFITGRVLYSRFGDDEALKKLFSRPETPSSKNKLLEALQALCQSTAEQGAKLSTSGLTGSEAAANLSKAIAQDKPHKTAAPVTHPAPAPTGAVSKQPDFSIFPMPDNSGDQVLEALQKNWKEKYSRMNYLRHSLDAYGRDNSPETIAACHPICKEILDLEQDVMALWAKRDYYLAHGQLPDIKTDDFVIPENPVELAKLITRLERYVRRYRQNVAEYPTNAQYAALLIKYQQQLTLVKAHGHEKN